MDFFDTLPVERTRRTSDGYLVADARAARTGIQVYTGAEAGRPELASVRMYRPAEEVFDRDSLASYAHKPVTNGHPSEPVSPKNYKAVAVGHIDGSVARDGECVRIPMMVADAATITDIDNGRVELSAGYRCIVDWTAGQTEAGEAYDAVQRKIRINHVAFVDRGRAGSECRIGDDATPPSIPEAPMTQKLTVDGITLDLSDTAAQVVGKVQRQLADAVADALAKDAALGKAKAEHATQLQAKDGEIAALNATHLTAIQAKDGEIAALRAQIPTGAALDDLAAARADLIGRARAVLGDGFTHVGKSDADIRKAVVEKALGDAAKTMSDGEITGAFKVVAAGKAGADPIRGALQTGTFGDGADPRKAAFDEMQASLTDAWKAAA